jgi:uncharacterized protein with HEPN domain
MRTDESYLLDILQAATDLRDATAGLRLQTIIEDRFLQRIVRSCLEDIGEASKKLSNEFKSRYPLIPWSELVSRRNWLAHEYFRVDYGEVWHFIESELPGLIETLRPLVPKERKP